jgi:hypothetical protein
MADIKTVMLDAAGKAAQKVMMSQIDELSDLTSASWLQIQTQLEQAAYDIAATLEDSLGSAVLSGSDRALSITEDYLFDLVGETDGKITRSGIMNMFIGLDRTFLESMVTRLSTDGYTFSERVWRTGTLFQEQIKRVIETGFALGRDVLEIAEDITVYVRYGKRALAKRYGGLIRGTAEWRARIHKNVDYSALRLVRSELYQSLRDASIRSGELNPACSGLYDWIRHSSEDWNCECPKHEKNGPYTAEQVPGYPHPNCLCTVQPRFRDLRQFSADLRAWVRGDNVEYIQQWYDTKYLPFAA